MLRFSVARLLPAPVKQYESALCHFAVGQQTIVNDLIGLEMECIAVGFGGQFNRESDYIQPTSVIRSGLGGYAKTTELYCGLNGPKSNTKFHVNFPHYNVNLSAIVFGQSAGKVENWKN